MMKNMMRTWAKAATSVVAGAAVVFSSVAVAAPAGAQTAQEFAVAQAENLRNAANSVSQLIAYYTEDFSNVADGEVMHTVEIDDVVYELVKSRENSMGGIVLSIGDTVSLDFAKELAAKVAEEPNVESVEADVVAVNFGATVNDPLFRNQWGLHGDNSANFPEVWSETAGEGQVVAVLDSGIYEHADLKANLVDGYDFISYPSLSRDGDGRDDDPTDPGNWLERDECSNNAARKSSWHGTTAAGVIAAEANNYGTVGAAHGVKIQPVRVLGPCGGETSDIADAIVWASGGEVPGVPSNPTPASVINLSLGGEGTCQATYQRAIDIATKNGAVVVTAAGNSRMDSNRVSPGNCFNVINVAATNASGSLSSYSNRGDSVMISAPGGESGGGGIMTTGNSGARTAQGDATVNFVGTSAAAPFVSAAVAILKSVDPSLDYHAIRELITSSATPLPTQPGSGAGRLNMLGAFEALTGRAPKAEEEVVEEAPAEEAPAEEVVVSEPAEEETTVKVEPKIDSNVRSEVEVKTEPVVSKTETESEKTVEVESDNTTTVKNVAEAQEGGLSTGGIIGIVIGILALLGVLGGIGGMMAM